MPTAIGITHQACGIGNQNKALRIIQNLAGEIALSLKLRLIGLQAADVEHESAVLSSCPVGAGDGKSVNQYMNGAAIFAFEHSFAISKTSLVLHFVEQLAVMFG